MYIIESGKDKLKWFSGVYLSEEKAENHYKFIKNDRYFPHQIKEIELSSYPIYVIDTSNSLFQYFNKKQLVSYFDNFQFLKDDDYVYEKLYTINKDYASIDASGDTMFTLKPISITNGFIQFMRSLNN